MTVEFVPIRPEHFVRIKLTEPDAPFGEVFQTEGRTLASLCNPRWSAAAVCGEKVLSLGGVLADGKAWFLISSEASLRQMLLVRDFTLEVIHRFMVDNPGLDVQATVDGSNPKRVRWATRMGFSKDSESGKWVLKHS